MDDIDDLLDEIEKEFAHKEKGKSSKTSSKNHRPMQIEIGEGPNPEWDEIDDDINDILEPDVDVSKGDVKNKPDKVLEKPKEANSENTKCFPMFLGGASMSRGLSTSCAKKSCNNIRCTSCDFKIVTFNNYQWHSSADYLFFRNMMPDSSKLHAKLRKCPGTVAYCCQCSWKSIKQPTAISLFKELKWVCGKH